MSKHMRLWIPVLFLVVLSGCMVGPNYKAPVTKVPEAFAGAETPPPASENVSRWWTTLNDPVLDSLIERAAKRNPDLRIAQARVREARALRGIVNAHLYPRVDVTGSYQRFRTSEDVIAGQGGDPSVIPDFDGDLFHAGFDAAWEIDVFGGKRREVEAATAEIDAEIENRRQVLVSLLAEVARNYVEMRAAQYRVRIAHENLRAQEETVEITKIRFDAGLVSDLDVARAEAQVQTTASQIPPLEASARQSMHRLSVLLALEPDALDAELAGEAPIPSAPTEVPPGLPSDLLRRRPDIRGAERRLAASTARIGVATADLFPKFSLTGALGLQSTDINSLDIGGSRYWSIIPGVSWPVLDFGKIRSNIAVQNAREEQAFVYYEKAVLDSLREVEDALVAFSENQKRREKLIGAVEANRRAVKLADELYASGLTDFLSVLQAQRDLFQSEDALALSDSSVTSDYIALYKALGGGWEIENPAGDAPPPGAPGERALQVGPAPTGGR
jgi:NodT family efflux transporter outer membrane factor (OMF) lipoprotein